MWVHRDSIYSREKILLTWVIFFKDSVSRTQPKWLSMVSLDLVEEMAGVPALFQTHYLRRPPSNASSVLNARGGVFIASLSVCPVCDNCDLSFLCSHSTTSSPPNESF